MVFLFPRRIGILVSNNYGNFSQPMIVQYNIEESQSEYNWSMTSEIPVGALDHSK